jgi:hypothetical protein
MVKRNENGFQKQDRHDYSTECQRDNRVNKVKRYSPRPHTLITFSLFCDAVDLGRFEPPGGGLRLGLEWEASTVFILRLFGDFWGPWMISAEPVSFGLGGRLS